MDKLTKTEQLEVDEVAELEEGEELEDAEEAEEEAVDDEEEAFDDDEDDDAEYEELSDDDDVIDIGINKETVAGATNDFNAIYKEGAAVAKEFKDAFDDIKSAFKLW